MWSDFISFSYPHASAGSSPLSRQRPASVLMKDGGCVQPHCSQTAHEEENK